MPWASTASMSVGVSPALANAWRITRCCEGPFGAVRPFEAPSWFTALPRITASTSWPRRCASESRSRTSIPAPSAQPTPSAPSENALHRPSAATPPQAGELHEHSRMGHHGHTTGQSHRALPGPQRLGGQVQRHQR